MGENLSSIGRPNCTQKMGDPFSVGITIVGIIIVIISLISTIVLMCINDSNKSNLNRSGMSIYTDYKTGVQYVGNSNGLHVRINPDGTPVLYKKY